MAPKSRVLIGLMAVIFWGQLAVVFFQIEAWPLNPYRMFSGYKKLESVKGYRLYVVTEKNERIPLDIKKVKFHFNEAFAQDPQIDIEKLNSGFQAALKENSEAHDKYPLSISTNRLELVRVRYDGTDDEGRIQFKENVIFTQVQMK